MAHAQVMMATVELNYTKFEMSRKILVNIISLYFRDEESMDTQDAVHGEVSIQNNSCCCSEGRSSVLYTSVES